MRRPVKITLWSLGSIVAIVALLGIAALLILPSSWFRDKVRTRVVYEVERASGGRVEIGSFRFDWSRLHAEVAPFVLHGTEPAGEPPLFRAESIQVELKIVSAFKRDVDIASLLVDRPQINLLVDKTGVTNFPKPAIDRPQSGQNPVEQLIALAVGRIDVRNGVLQYGDQKLPLVLAGENMNASLAYNFTGPNYEGRLNMEKLLVHAAPTLPMNVSFDSHIGLFKDSIRVNSARMTMPDAQVEFAGVVEDFSSVKVNFDVQANGSLKELGKPLRLPEPHAGHVQFKGKLNYGPIEKLRIGGRLTGQGLAFRQAGVAVQDIAVASDVKLDLDRVNLTGLRVDALEGRFDGMLEIHKFKTYVANGKVTGLSVARLTGAAGLKGGEFSGFVSGPVELKGTFGSTARDLRAAGRLDVVAGTAGLPIKGFVEAAYDQRNQSLQLGQSFLQLPSSRVDFNGTFGEMLTIRLESTDLNDFTPVIASASGNAPEKLPLALASGGTAVFTGSVAGPADTARVKGDLTLDRFEVSGQKIDRLVAKLDATGSEAHFASFALGQNTMRLAGNADVTLENWKFMDASAVKASVKLEGAQIAKLLAERGRKDPIDGILSGAIEVQGTAADPKASAKIFIDKPVFYGEKFDRIRAGVRYAGVGVEVIDGVAELGSARIMLSGAFEHPVADFTNGRLRFQAATKGFALEKLHNVQTLRPGVEGSFELELAGLINIKNGEMFPQTLDGDLALRELNVQGRAVGDFTVDAKTTGRELIFGVAGNLHGSKVTGGGTFELAGDYPGTGRVEFTPLSFSTLQDLLTVAKGREPMPVEGTVEGKITFSGPAKKPELMRARVELPVVQVSASRRMPAEKASDELSLRNAEPIIAEYDGKALHVKSAHLVGPESDLRITGGAGLTEKAAYDLKVDGSLNLGILQNFEADLVSSGVATVDASVRGSLNDPNISGRMVLKNASFSMVDLPNGLDNASGTIVFDKHRATIEKLTAQTGGGDLALSGFVQFGSEMAYSLQARGDRVRIRYPEGVSTTANATLNLTGSTKNSLMTGVITIARAGFNPRTDVGSLLAEAKPTATPVNPSAFLRGMHLDVRIETIPNLQFQTSLTQDLQAEADLRLKGNAAKPVLLGRVVVNQGEIQFFGNKYLINRGEIGFFNPVKIEPVLDMDLETRVRGILVNINFSGTLSKLNVSYRSDPPLQSTEIVALLAVGRAPGSNSSLASSQTLTNQSVLSSGNSLLGQAVAAPVSSRLQRFFGVSRLKIDPLLTGVNAVPQARLTIEQQISRDVTLTYITNLAQANSQIVQLQWDINRTWSVVALREENGVFGIDFFYKKRLK